MKALFFVFSLLLLVGCGSVPVDSRREASLMPESIAKRVLVKHLGASWVANPRGRYVQGFGQFCGEDGHGDLPFADINVVRSFPHVNTLMLTKTNWLTAGFPCTQLAHQVIGDFSAEDVKDIVDALVSLGARIDQGSP